jgi:superfamily II DNA or RNA helicase
LGGELDFTNEKLKFLLLARKRIIHKAENKLDIFKQIVTNRFDEKGNLKYTLVYVPEGIIPDNEGDIFDVRETITDDPDSDKLIDQYTAAVRDIDDSVTVKKFTSGTSERDSILQDFADGKLQVLTSMKCLDEGVDVPRSELAIFCASTGNPRQFIQRRGRILRTHKDKYQAVIHDLVVIPDIDPSMESYNVERNLLAGELKRVNNFALLSENSADTLKVLDPILEYYNLSLF